MNQLPISLVFFTSTKGHFGRKTDWLVTLDHWNRQLPLANFGERIAHIKVTPGDEALAAGMALGLTAKGFHVIQTVGSWDRGLSHGANYLGDQVTVSKDARLYKQPYLLFLEDDSLALSHQIPLDDLLAQSCRRLAENHELLTVRLMRRHDDRGPTALQAAPDPRFYYSQDVNFQPLVMRSLDFYRLGLALEANPDACQQIQCERLWRLILDHSSRSPFKHIVYEPDYAETAHIGIPQAEHEQLVKQLHLHERHS